jgi:hypothetical protein
MESLGNLQLACGQAYEVADEMGSNTNQLLRLAYDFSRRLFLKDDGWENDGEEKGRLRPSRTRNWGDVFLRFPRAYLLISTSVDYYLSTGRLPSSSCLPEFVRSTLPLGLTLVFEVELPWDVDNPEQDAKRSFRQGSLASHHSATAQPTMVRGNSICQQTELLTYDQNMAPSDTNSLSTIRSMIRYPQKPSINLNYFCMDALLETGQSKNSRFRTDDFPINSASDQLIDLATSENERDLWSALELVA